MFNELSNKIIKHCRVNFETTFVVLNGLTQVLYDNLVINNIC